MKVNDPDLPLTRGRQMNTEQTGSWRIVRHADPFSPRHRSRQKHEAISQLMLALPVLENVDK